MGEENHLVGCVVCAVSVCIIQAATLVCHWPGVWHYDTVGVVMVTLCVCDVACFVFWAASNQQGSVVRQLVIVAFPGRLCLGSILASEPPLGPRATPLVHWESICPWMANAHLTLPLLS